MTASSVGPVPSPSTSAVILRVTRKEAAGAALKIGGLTVLQRSLRQLARARHLRIVVAADGAVPLAAGALPANVELRDLGSDPEVQIAFLVRDTPGALVLAGDVVRRQGDPLDGGVRVVDETTRRQAEDAIFSDLLRGDLGVIARHLNKRISFRITRYLFCKLPITPNQVTLLAAAIGFLGCLVIATGTYSGTVAGFLLVQAQSVLDGCDGELARIRFQQSALGEWLDTVADDALNLALVASMGVGLWRSGHGWPATLASAAACLMLLVYNVVAYRELVRQGVGGEVLKIRWTLARGVDLKSLMTDGHTQRGVAGQVARLLVTLGRKDVFIFSWLLLAAMNLLPVALFWAVLIALSCFVTALAQLLMPRRGS